MHTCMYLYYVCMYTHTHTHTRCNNDDEDELLIGLFIRRCDDAESLYDTDYSKSEHQF